MIKKIKRLMPIVLSAVLALGIVTPVSAVTYSDMAGQPSAQAVNVLSGLNVINGYTEDGKTVFKPDKTVTRAEMAKLLVAAMGKTSQATDTDTGFSDVASTNWAAPYVAYAASKGIVNGVGNGMFSPSSTVTYNQAMKMIVGALGYTDECNEIKNAGAWDVAYPAKAAALGITEGISGSGNDGATRGDCAIMLYNALNVANVYAGLDGETNLMPGTTDVTYNGEKTTGTNWMASLLTTGGAKYMVINASDAKGSSVDVNAYIGQAATVFLNSRNRIISYLDSDTTLLTGVISSDGKSITSDGTTYSFANAKLMRFASIDDGTAIEVDSVPYMYNGALSSVRSDSGSYSGEVAMLNNGMLQIVKPEQDGYTPITISGNATVTAVVENGTITEIWAVNKTATNAGRTTSYEWNRKNTSPVLYWAVDSVTEGKSVTLTLTATEAGSVGYMVDDAAGIQHVSLTPDKINQGVNTYTVDISKADLKSGGTGYIHLGYSTTDEEAHMVTTISFTNKTASY